MSWSDGDALTPANLNAKSGIVFNVQDEAYGAAGDGTTDDTAAIQAAWDALITAGRGTILFPPGTYKITATISGALPERLTRIVAHGASFTTGASEIVMFDINPARVANGWDGGDTDTMRFVRWEGGEFVSAAATKTTSRAIRAWGMRHFKIEGAYFEDWGAAIEIAGKDTYQIGHCYFRTNTYSVLHPNDTTTGIAALGDLPLCISLYDNHHAGAATSHVAILTKCFNFKVAGDVFAGACTGPQIHLQDSTLLGGECYYLLDNHHEQIAESQYAVRFDDANGTGFSNVNVTGNSYVSGTAGWKGLGFERCAGVYVEGNRFRDGSGGSTEVTAEFDANCTQIVWGATNTLSGIAAAGRPSFNASIAREQYTVQPSFRSDQVAVTGYNLSAFSTGTATLDMSSVAATVWPSFGVPKGYFLHLLVRDSGSAAGSGVRALVQKSSGGADTNALRVELDGVGNDELRMAGGYVEADANGDIYIAYTASGTDTMDIALNVVGVVM